MKKRLIALWIIVGLVPLFSFSQFTSRFVDIPEDQQVIFKRIIDNTYGPFLQRNTIDLEFKDKLANIRNTLVQYINTNYTSDTVFFALEYLVFRIESTLETHEEVLNTKTVLVQTTAPVVAVPTTVSHTNSNQPTQTTTSPEPIAVQQTTTQEVVTETQYPFLDVSSYYDGDKNILAGTITHPVFKYELVAQLEWVLIEQLAFAANTSDFDKAVKKVLLYDEDGNRIAEENPKTNLVTFRNIDREIPKWQTDMYVVLETAPIGYNFSAPQTTTLFLNLDIQEAKGVISWNDYPVQSFANNEWITIVPSLVTHALLTDSRESKRINTRLSEWEKDLAIVVLWAKVGKNTSTTSGRSLNTVLERIQIQVQDNTSIGNVSYNMYLRALQWGADKVLWSFQNGVIVFDLSELWNDALLSDEEEVAFIISWEIPPLDLWTQESVNVTLDNTDTWGIAYKTSDPISLTITDLNLKNRAINQITLTD